MQGWISIHRQIKENWIWNDKPFSKGQAWVDILLRVNHKARKVPVGNQIIDVEPGQTIWSIKDMSEQWGWSRKKTDSFLKMLENDEMLHTKRTSKYTLVTVAKWEVYQVEGASKEHQKNINGTSTEHQSPTNNNDNNENHDNNDNKNIYIEPIVKLWNSKDQLSNHKASTKRIIEAIEGNILTEDDYDKAKQGIEIYYHAFIDSTFYYSHSFKLGPFISQDNGFRDWCTGGIRYNEFKLHKDKSNKKDKVDKPKTKFHDFDSHDHSDVDLNDRFGMNGFKK